MSSLNTKFTRLMGIQTPLVCGNMAGASGGRLAAEVRLAGSFGFVSAGYDSAEKLQQEIDLARSLLKPEPNAILPIGVGYLAWQLEKPGAPAEQLIQVALENQVQAIWLSFGERMHDWINLVRQKEKVEGTTKIFVQISSLEEALVAMNEWKVDVIVAQGREAGGHGAAEGLPLLALVSQIIPAIPKDGPPLLAAGGLADGNHLASYLTLGTSGVVFGTRFLVAPESLYKDEQRQRLLQADSSSSIRSMAFDHARGTLGWPKGIDGRGLYNDTVRDFQEGLSDEILQSRYAEGLKKNDPSRIVSWGGLYNDTVRDFQEGLSDEILQSRYAEGLKKNDPSRIVSWAGTGVGLITRAQTAKDIVVEVHNDCVASLKLALTYLSD